MISAFGIDHGTAVFKSQTTLTPKQRRERTQARVGLASNVFGITAGGAALYAAAKNPALRKPSPKLAGPVTSRALKYVRSDRGKARIIQSGAAGAVGLQAGNLGGDAITNVVLQRESKKGSR